METTQFNPDTGLLEVILVHDDENCDDSGSATNELTSDLESAKIEPAASLDNLDIDEEVVEDQSNMEPELTDLSEAEDDIIDVSTIDIETIEENKQEQQDEMECLFSIYGHDYGTVTDSSFVIKLSAGHFVVRFQVTYPENYPSHAPPEPLILGAYWKSFDHQKVLVALDEMFTEGCACVYDWAVYIQEYLQIMMDNYAAELRWKDPKTFVETINYNRAQLERFLNADDLFDANGWVETLTYDQRKKLWKLIRKKLRNDTDPILKKAKKICPGINMMRLYWFCAYLENELESHEVPTDLQNNKKADVKEALCLKEISLTSKALITVEGRRVLVIGDEEEQSVAAHLFEYAVLKRNVQALLTIPSNSHGVLYRQEISHDALAFYHYYLLIKINDFDLAKFSSIFCKRDLYTIRHELQTAQRRRLAKQRQIFATAKRFVYQPRQVYSGGDLTSLFGGSRLKKIADGHMFMPLGGKKSKKGNRSSQTVYHGTAARNASSIIRQGLRVNGGKENPANGAAYGRGIYTSPNVNIPFSYAGQQALSHNGKNWLCIFECRATAGKQVSGGIFLIPNDKDCAVVGLHLYRTS